MALTESFYEAVSSGNVRRVRIMMKDSLLVDPTFAQFEQMEIAASSLAELYQEHDGRELITDKSMWNDDYMNTLMVQVISNYSHERVEHLKQVVRYLRPVQKQESAKTKEHFSTDNVPSSTPYQKQKQADQAKGTIRIVKISSGALVGAAVGGVVTSVTNAPLLAGLTLGAVAGASVVFLATMGGK